MQKPNLSSRSNRSLVTRARTNRVSANPKPQGTVLDDKAADYVLDDQNRFSIADGIAAPHQYFLAVDRARSDANEICGAGETLRTRANVAKRTRPAKRPWMSPPLKVSSTGCGRSISLRPHQIRLTGAGHTVGLTARGRRVAEDAIPTAKIITEETLSPLSRKDREMLLQLIRKLC